MIIIVLETTAEQYLILLKKKSLIQTVFKKYKHKTGIPVKSLGGGELTCKMSKRKNKRISFRF